MDFSTITNMGPAAGAILGGIAIGLAAFAVVSNRLERREIDETFSYIDNYQVGSASAGGGESALSSSFTDRVVKKVFRGAGGLGRRFTPVGYVEKVRRNFVLAGRDSTAEVDKFLAMRVIALVAIPGWLFFMFIWNPLGVSGLIQWVLVIIGVAYLVTGADSKLKNDVTKRQQQIRLDLPDVLDLLTISVEAGLGFEQALDRTIDTVPGPLSTEFARMLGETRAGASRAQAMRSMDDRIGIPEIRSFVLAILQADSFGVSIGRTLRAQADDMRVRRRQMAQETAQKAPVKMLAPMGLCIFPALFVVILVPAAIQIADKLG